MNEQSKFDYEKYLQIAQMAKMGWWESDLKNKEYICSDFIVDLLGLDSTRISFTDFHQRIREDHRLRLKNEFLSLSNLEIYEQMFPMHLAELVRPLGDAWHIIKVLAGEQAVLRRATSPSSSIRAALISASPYPVEQE